MMKKLFLWFVFLTVGMQAQVINFPDANFKAKLLQADVSNNIAKDMYGNSIKIDANNNGAIEIEEVEEVRHLDINNSNISSVEGIENFINLFDFNCSNNQLTSLNLSLYELGTLNCSNNQLTILNLTNTVYLSLLDCSHNSLQSLDVSHFFGNLTDINCSYNNLTNVSLPNGYADNGEYNVYVFFNFNLSHNQLGSLNIKNKYISNLDCSYNQLTSLDFQDQFKHELLSLNLVNNPGLTSICKNENDILPDTGIISQNVCNNPILGFDPGLKKLLLSGFYDPNNTCDDVFWGVKDINRNCITVDINADGELSQNEVDPIGYINILQGSGNFDYFETTTGINHLTNLKGIEGGIISTYSRSTGNLGNIDIDGLNNLEYISLGQFFVKSINIKNAANLKTVFTGTHHGYGIGDSSFFNFENCPSLISISAGQSGVKSLSFKNSQAVKTIELTGNNLSALDISLLPNLEELHIGNYHDYGQTDIIDFPNNGITTLDLTKNAKLKDLDCNKNSLLSLDVLSCPLLQRINCSKNQLTSFDAHGLTLTGGNTSPFNPQASLDCSNNNLTNLNISNAKITMLFCNNNHLSNLDLSDQQSLSHLQCQQNDLTSLSLDNNPSLHIIDCSYNDLKELDISHTSELTDFIFHNNPSLEYLLMKNGNDDSYPLSYNSYDVSPYTSTNIKYICADDSEVDQLRADLQLWNLTSININSYCSFVPGGSYNTISGTVKIDTNGNGCDVSDSAFEYLKLKIEDGTNSGETFVQNDGKYDFYTQAGNFTVTAAAENPGLFNVMPASFSTSFADNNNQIFTQDICVTANGAQNDAEVVIAPLTGARPGFDATYKLVWRNKGNTTLSGKVIFNYDSNKITFKESTLPYSAISSGSIEFDYSGLKPYANDGSEITFTVNTPTNSTNPVNSGDVLAFNAQITPNNGDLSPEDNNFSFNHTVVNSFDPNDIVCMEGEIIPSVAVGKYLHYVVNFENTGTAEAENIVVKMDIDPSEFDISTLQLQNASDNVTTKITGNTAEFIFKKIKLKSGGHGNVLLKLKSLSGLQEGDSVNNNAEIYFDYNFPVTTNDYVTTIRDKSSILEAKIHYTADDFTTNNYPVNFDGSLSTGNVVSYLWEFSGSASVPTSTAAKPLVTYTTPGNYTVKLTVSDADNNSHSQTVSFKIGDTAADISTGKDSNGNFTAIDSDDDDWKGYDINGAEITPKVRHTFTGWSNADIGNGNTSQWITLNNSEGYYNYKSRAFTIPENASDAKLNLRSLSFVRNWTYLVKVNPDGSEDETEITKTQFLSDGAKGWLNSRSPKVDNYALSAGTYYIKVLVYSSNPSVRESLDVNAVITCSAGLINANKLAVSTPTLGTADADSDRISIYPNPTKGEVTLTANEKITSVEVYDFTGRIIQKSGFGTTSKKERITITASRGIYYLKVKTEKGEITRKIIKE